MVRLSLMDMVSVKLDKEQLKDYDWWQEIEVIQKERIGQDTCFPYLLVNT